MNSLRPTSQTGFTILEVLIALTLVTGAASACVIAVLQASVRIDDVMAEQVALRHFRSAAALRLNIPTYLCGESLRTALKLSEPIPDSICVDMTCSAMHCYGHLRWGSARDQSAVI